MVQKSVQVKSGTRMSLGGTLAIGFAAGTIVAIPDVFQAVQSMPAANLRASLAYRILLTTCWSSIILCFLSFFASAAAHWLHRRFSMGIRLSFPALLAGISIPWFIYVSICLFQGGFTSRLPFVPLLMGGTATLFVVGAFIVFNITFRSFVRLDEQGHTQQRLIWCLGLLAIAASMRWCDATFYKRLYTYLHTTLALGTLCFTALALRSLLPPAHVGKVHRQVGGTFLFVFLIAGTHATVFPLRSQTVQMAIGENTATTAAFYRLMPWNRVVTEITYRTSEERDKRLDSVIPRIASAADLPTFPNGNFVLISVDALRADRLGAYGHTERRLTPHIDRFAQGATLFKRAYCTAPHSSFSITSLHTSHNTHVESHLKKEITAPTIAEVLRDRGYETVGIYTTGIFYTAGELVSHYRDNNFGFALVEDIASPPEKMTDRAIAHLRENSVSDSPPLFMWVHYFNVHEPYRSTRYGKSPRDRYDGEVREADEAINRLLVFIDEHVTRKTIVALVADHGEEFEEHGGFYHGSSLYEEQVRVPFILRAPGTAGLVVNTPVSLLDLATTVLPLLDASVPLGMLGRDLRSAVFTGGEGLVEAPVFANVMKQHMVVEWPWKLIANPGAGLFKLFNLENDPAEKENLFDSATHQGEILETKWQRWIDQIAAGGDPAQTALNMGRVRDRRAVPVLLALAHDATQSDKNRTDALDLLAQIHPWNAGERLFPLLSDKQKAIAVRAALVLAAIGDRRGKPLLVEGLKADDEGVRHACAIALGGFGEKRAVEGLIDTLSSSDVHTRKDAVRLLGDLGDNRAIMPLIANLKDRKIRSMSMVSLGKLKAREAVEPILDILNTEKLVNIRGYAVMGLGLIGDTATAHRLMRVLREEPEIQWTSQSLIHTGAIKQGLLAGADISKETKRRGQGFSRCDTVNGDTIKSYLGSTTCTTKNNKASVGFQSKSMALQTLLIRLRSANETDLPMGAVVRLDGAKIGEVALSDTQKEFRLDMVGKTLGAGKHKLEVETNAGAFEWDHFLLVPAQKAFQTEIN